MAALHIGRLERHDLRNIWTNEAADFTPWLAKPENLLMLGEALGMELELEAQERAVGPFRADILCRDLRNDHWVLIENQLERTNHGHLGQLLTYASGLDAVTIVWIAANFTEEHRATLDWLNKITDDTFRFFGLEVELWRIGDSAAAPKFNVVSKPNDWSHSVAQAARAIDEDGLSVTRVLQRNYWAALNTVLDSTGGSVMGNKKPQPQRWMSYPIGRDRMHLNALMVRNRKQIRSELHLGGAHAKIYFQMLQAQKSEIEQALGYPLDWEELPEAQDSRISTCLNEVDPENEADWKRQHDWLAKRLNDLHRVFAPRVAVLDADTAQPDAA